MTVSDTCSSAGPPLVARPPRAPVTAPPPPRPSREEVESAEEIVARLERWIAASQSDALRTAVTAPASGAQPPPPPPPTAPGEHDDLLPSDPAWSAILNEDIAPFGLATVACLVTLLAYVALGLRNGSIASGAMLLGAIGAGHRHGHSALATRIIVGVALGVAIAVLS